MIVHVPTRSRRIEMSKNESKSGGGISRRKFLTGTAAGAAGLVLAGCQPAVAPTVPPTTAPAVAAAVPTAAKCPQLWLPAKWDYETELLFVGYGGAGALGAINAFDAGAKVLILEKQAADTPTAVNHTPSTSFAMGSFNKWIGSADDALKYLTFGLHGMVPVDVMKAYISKWMDLDTWIIKTLGSDIPPSTKGGTGPGEFPADMPGLAGGANKSSLKYTVAGTGRSAFDLFEKNIAKRNIQILWQTPAKRLIVNTDTGEVVGVEATAGGKPVFVKAKKAVILSCGGLYGNKGLVDEAFKAHFEFYGNPGNTGDGYVMATAVGADAWHMSCAAGRVGIARFPGTPTGLAISMVDLNLKAGAIGVDKYGERFGDENVYGIGHSTFIYAYWWDPERLEYPRIPTWSIFDEARRLSSSLLSSQGQTVVTRGLIKWSEGAVDEIAKGWILKGATLDELVAKIKADPDNAGAMDPATLKSAVEKYNQGCAAGKDEFGRAKTSLQPLTTPPYYAIKVFPGGPNTWGGPKKNGNGEVLRADGTAIKRLYVAGELSSIDTLAYPLNNMGEIAITGRIAADHAITLKPWDA
jgi:3-oxosteroid 1-dehydrogenase